ncbi:MAG: hypothetical protein QNJ81_04225 [Acidimicrobiia bacterium]|nr:hypothetical protein [Acidimicrobiia bacterium]
MSTSEVNSEERFEQLRIEGQPLLTTEARWFAPGPPPQGFIDWFAQGGRAAVVELRCDSYRQIVDPGVGLKRRDNGPLELKRRSSVTPPQRFSLGLSGRVEEWCKTGLEEPPRRTDWQWSVVDKVVLTRTFLLDDDDVAVEGSRRELSAPACDIELATVTVGDLVAWSFALEAWGDEPVRKQLLHRALHALMGDLDPIPPGFVSALNLNMGYPEWLASVAWNDQIISR